MPLARDGSRRRDGSGNWHAIQETDDTIQVELFAGINSDLIQSSWTKALYVRTTKMPNRTKSALAALLFFWLRLSGFGGYQQPDRPFWFRRPTRGVGDHVPRSQRGRES